MNWLKWIKLIMSLAGKIDLARLLKLPDLQDSGDTQAWTACVLDAGGVCAELTPTDVDDEAVDALRAIVEDDEAWAAIFGLIQIFVDDGGDLVFSGEPTPEVNAVGEKLGISPLLILSIIKAIVELLKWFRDRRTGE